MKPSLSAADFPFVESLLEHRTKSYPHDIYPSVLALCAFFGPRVVAPVAHRVIYTRCARGKQMEIHSTSRSVAVEHNKRDLAYTYTRMPVRFYWRIRFNYAVPLLSSPSADVHRHNAPAPANTGINKPHSGCVNKYTQWSRTK